MCLKLNGFKWNVSSLLIDPIADYLTRLRNAIGAKHRVVEVPASNLKKECDTSSALPGGSADLIPNPAASQTVPADGQDAAFQMHFIDVGQALSVLVECDGQLSYFLAISAAFTSSASK